MILSLFSISSRFGPRNLLALHFSLFYLPVEDMFSISQHRAGVRKNSQVSSMQCRPVLTIQVGCSYSSFSSRRSSVRRQGKVALGTLYLLMIGNISLGLVDRNDRFLLSLLGRH